jgi:FtsH-binding integral membrane protein
MVKIMKFNSTTNYTSAASVDVGLRQFMLTVYNYMAGALALTGFLAMLVGTNPTLAGLVFGTPFSIVFMFAPLVLAVMFSVRLHSMSVGSAQTIFWAYAASMGISLGAIFLVYTGESIARTFFITASMFAVMSLYGYTTKKDLTSFGSFLIMGLIGIFIAGLVNLFLQSQAIQFVTSFLGVIIFTGLVAYDTQRVKEHYYAAPDGTAATKFAIFGALMLYMDFINIFIHLLRFFGDRRD